jgi:hypothetical protein
MSRGISYLGLIGALRDDDILREVRDRQRSTDTIRRRRGRTLGATLLRVLTGRKN